MKVRASKSCVVKTFSKDKDKKNVVDIIGLRVGSKAYDENGVEYIFTKESLIDNVKSFEGKPVTIGAKSYTNGGITINHQFIDDGVILSSEFVDPDVKMSLELRNEKTYKLLDTEWFGGLSQEGDAIKVNDNNEILEMKGLAMSILVWPIEPACPLTECGIITKSNVGSPFGNYKDFDDCVKKNQDKRSPEGYCGAIENNANKNKKKSDIMTDNNNISNSTTSMTIPFTNGTVGSDGAWLYKYSDTSSGIPVSNTITISGIPSIVSEKCPKKQISEIISKAISQMNDDEKKDMMQKVQKMDRNDVDTMYDMMLTKERLANLPDDMMQMMMQMMLMDDKTGKVMKDMMAEMDDKTKTQTVQASKNISKSAEQDKPVTKEEADNAKKFIQEHMGELQDYQVVKMYDMMKNMMQMTDEMDKEKTKEQNAQAKAQSNAQSNVQSNAQSNVQSNAQKLGDSVTPEEADKLTKENEALKAKVAELEKQLADKGAESKQKEEALAQAQAQLAQKELESKKVIAQEIMTLSKDYKEEDLLKMPAGQLIFARDLAKKTVSNAPAKPGKILSSADPGFVVPTEDSNGFTVGRPDHEYQQNKRE